MARGDSAGALQAFDEARTIFSNLYGSRNAAVGDVDFYAAEAAARGKDVEGALRLLDQTKGIYDASYGPNDPDQVELLMSRARVLAGAGRFDDSALACASAVTLQAKLDPHDPSLAANRLTCEQFKGGRRPW
jgi:hypothetical protein